MTTAPNIDQVEEILARIRERGYSDAAVAANVANIITKPSRWWTAARAAWILEAAARLEARTSATSAADPAEVARFTAVLESSVGLVRR